MLVEIWSDIACPWCYIGKRRFEAALAGFEHRGDVDVVWKAFELDPQAVGAKEGSYAERLAVKYGRSLPEAQQMLDNMTAAAAAEGLDFHFENAQSGPTFDAHRLLHLALDQGVQDAVKESLVRAYFTEGVAVHDREQLVRIGEEAGLDADTVRQMLADGSFATEVRADEAEAQELGISGVPFFVIDRRYAISGAQPAELIGRALTQAWESRTPLTVVSGEAGESCSGDSCAV